MTDVVDNTVVHNGRRYVTHHTNVSDNTGESAVTKVDISGLTIFPSATVPTYTIVDRIEYNIQGFTSVRLFWDHTTDDEIAVLPTGSGVLDWSTVGGKVDPRTSGDTGDIKLTTAGSASGNTYDITLYLRLKA